MAGERRARYFNAPAPVGGWNARDSIVTMPLSDAVKMENWYPYTTYAGVRLGSEDHVTGFSDDVETLASYNSGATSKLFAVAGGSIYDASTAGAVGAAVVTGLTNSRWQHANFSAGGGDYLYMVNGVDKPRVYTGASWVAVDNASTPAITGVTTTTLSQVMAHQNRLWFIQKNTLSVWYLATSAIGGAATQFPMQALFGRGGRLVAMGSWTLDSGSGMDDHAVFITSEGEVAVYQGTDPSSASTWSLKGLYYIGQPVGDRAMAQYASDLLIVCRDGLQPMSKALASSRVTTQTSLTDKIQTAINEVIGLYSNSFGWEVCVYAPGNLLILNVPVTNNKQQYVMNTVTGSWCKFTGWSANCFEVFNDKLYFGGADAVTEAWTGTSDNGANINTEVIQAYSQMGYGALKSFRMARPLLAMDATIGLSVGIETDYNISATLSAPTISPSSYGVWDSSVWDAAIWGGDPEIRKEWITVTGMGYSAAMHIRTATNNAVVNWYGTDYTFEVARGL